MKYFPEALNTNYLEVLRFPLVLIKVEENLCSPCPCKSVFW